MPAGRLSSSPRSVEVTAEVGRYGVLQVCGCGGSGVWGRGRSEDDPVSPKTSPGGRRRPHWPETLPDVEGLGRKRSYSTSTGGSSTTLRARRRPSRAPQRPGPAGRTRPCQPEYDPGRPKTSCSARRRPSQRSPAPNHHGLSARAWRLGPARRGQTRRQPLRCSHRDPRTRTASLQMDRVRALGPSESASEAVQPQAGGPSAGRWSKWMRAVQFRDEGGRPVPGSTPCQKQAGRGGERGGGGRPWRRARATFCTTLGDAARPSCTLHDPGVVVQHTPRSSNAARGRASTYGAG